MELRNIWRRKAAADTPKKKTHIPKGPGLFIMFLLGVIGIVAIMVILFDDYTITAWVSNTQLYWLGRPNISRMWIILGFILTAIFGHIFLPVVHYVGPNGRPQLNIYLGWYMLDEDTAVLLLPGGKRILCHKDRLKWYLFSVYIAGEYRYYVGDDETIILEGSNYEVSAINTLRKRLEAAEKEASLWQYKYMQLLENLQPYMENKGGGDNAGD